MLIYSLWQFTITKQTSSRVDEDLEEYKIK